MTDRPRPLILLVDDENAFPDIMTAKLGAAGLDTAIVHTAEEAIAKSAELMPDLVLMDVYMPPGPSGTDTALAIKQQPATRDLKIAFLSSLAEPWPGLPGDNREGVSQELGMETFLDKGADLDELVLKITELIGRS